VGGGGGGASIKNFHSGNETNTLGSGSRNRKIRITLITRFVVPEVPGDGERKLLGDGGGEGIVTAVFRITSSSRH